MNLLTYPELGGFMSEYARLDKAISFNYRKEVQAVIDHLAKGKELLKRPIDDDERTISLHDWLIKTNFIEEEIKRKEWLIARIIDPKAS